MKIGILKSKIEKILSESYSKGTFKEEINNFNRNVLSNKNISKLFYLYDELSTNKGFEKPIADEFLNESITVFENIINKIQNKDLERLRRWTIGVNAHNQYKDIDNFLYNSSDVTNLENKIISKHKIFETLTKKNTLQTETVINVPLSSMVNIANNTINSFLSELNESERNELNLILSEDNEILEKKFNSLKDEAIIKLVTTLNEEENDENLNSAINEVIETIKSKEFDKIEYFRLKNLVNGL